MAQGNPSTTALLYIIQPGSVNFIGKNSKEYLKTCSYTL